MSGKRAPVAVVVVTLNSASFVEGCLGSLGRLVRPPAEIVVVDGGSTDGSAERVRRGYPEVALVEVGENIGFCSANNLGIARTSSPFVLVLNPDTRLEPDFLEHLLPAFDDPQTGIACGKLLRFDGSTLDSAGQELARSRRPLDRGYGRPDRGRFERDEEVFGACAAAALYRRDMLDAIADPGGEIFDETFFAFYEDLDVAWRARHLGWKAVYRHRAVGYHARGGTSSTPGGARRGRAMFGRSPTLRFHIVKNRYRTVLRNDRPGAFLRDAPFILARDAAVACALLVWSPGVLVRLIRDRRVFREALDRRRRDRSRPGYRTRISLRGWRGSD